MTHSPLTPAVPNQTDPLTLPLPDPVPLAGVGELFRAVPYLARPGYRPLLLDLYRPLQTPAAPLVLFLHGGGWRFGDRTVFCPTWRDWQPDPFTRLVAAGFAVASVDYRLSGEAGFPAPLADATSALDWLTHRAGELRIDAGSVVLWGESAGAHLAALLGLSQPTADRVAGVIDWYGPADLLSGPGADDPDSREALLLGATPTEAIDLARAASPVAQVHPAAPPFHIAHGEADRFVPASQSQALAAALETAGVPVELHLVPDADHLWMRAADPHLIFSRAVDFALRVCAQQNQRTSTAG